MIEKLENLFNINQLAKFYYSIGDYERMYIYCREFKKLKNDIVGTIYATGFPNDMELKYKEMLKERITTWQEYGVYNE